MKVTFEVFDPEIKQMYESGDKMKMLDAIAMAAEALVLEATGMTEGAALYSVHIEPKAKDLKKGKK